MALRCRLSRLCFMGRGTLALSRDKLPLADIIAANLDHYRLDADYKHGLHFAALPTAWVSGFDKAAALRIGSSSAWVVGHPGCDGWVPGVHGRGPWAPGAGDGKGGATDVAARSANARRQQVGR